MIGTRTHLDLYLCGLAVHLPVQNRRRQAARAGVVELNKLLLRKETTSLFCGFDLINCK